MLADGGLVLVEKLRSKIELNRFEFNKTLFPMTMSFGVSQFNAEDKTIDQCVKHANQCLLKQKKKEEIK